MGQRGERENICHTNLNVMHIDVSVSILFAKDCRLPDFFCFSFCFFSFCLCSQIETLTFYGLSVGKNCNNLKHDRSKGSGSNTICVVNQF